MEMEEKMNRRGVLGARFMEEVRPTSLDFH